MLASSSPSITTASNRAVRRDRLSSPRHVELQDSVFLALDPGHLGGEAGSELTGVEVAPVVPSRSATMPPRIVVRAILVARSTLAISL